MKKTDFNRKMRHTTAITIAKRLLVMILLGVIVLCLSSVSGLTPTPASSLCYQETANASHANDGWCKLTNVSVLNYTGSYYGFVANAMIDGNWATGQSMSTVGTTFYVNYTYPTTFNNGTKYRISFNPGSEKNITVNSSCLARLDRKLMIYVNTTTSAYMKVSCMNETDYVTMDLVNLGNPYNNLYEEAIYWNTTNIIENNSIYNSNVYETSQESIVLKVVYDSSYYQNLDAKLYYNGTEYSSNATLSGNIATFNATVIIPDVASTTNLSFYWNITAYTGTSSTVYRGNTYTQQAFNITLASCSAAYPTKAYNFTVWNEKNLSRIMLHDFYGTFNYGITNKPNEVLIDNNNVNETNICLHPNTTIYVDADIEYSFDSNFVIRDYFLINDAASNNTQHINLYLLPVEDSTTFIIKVQDIELQAMSGVYVVVDRYYPATDTYKTVQIVRTDGNGKSVAFYEAENAYYRHTIKDANGNILYQSETAKIFPESVPYTLTFTVGDTIENPITDFTESDLVNYSLTFNDATKIVTLQYIDSSSEFELGRLYVKQNKYSTSDSLVCNTNSTLSTATITCNLSNYTSGAFTAKFYFTRDSSGEILEDVEIFEISDVIETMGNEGLFLAWFIILTAGMIFMVNMIVGIWAINVAVIFTNLIGLARFNSTWIFGMIAISIILTIVLKQE